MARHSKRFTIYDMMEAKGVFEANPANADSRDPVTGDSLYAGPVQYPKMLYSPVGAERIRVPAEIVLTPLGPKELNEQRELVHQLVDSPEEEERLRKLGWHDHPAKAMTAAGKVAPPMTSSSRIAELEREIASLQAERAKSVREAKAQARAQV